MENAKVITTIEQEDRFNFSKYVNEHLAGGWKIGHVNNFIKQKDMNIGQEYDCIVYTAILYKTK